MEKSARIFVAGHRGMVGSAIVRALTAAGYSTLVLRTSNELDLRRQADVERFFQNEKPEYVFLAAAKVGGILANNTYRADFLYENLMIQNNVIHQSYKNGVRKLMFLGSSCIYPKMAPQPLKEEYLLTGELEPTNEPYAIAKIAGIKMCDAYRQQYGCNFVSVMPSNLYGPHDNYDLQTAHVLPALIRKFHTAVKKNEPAVAVWGTGTPRREFLHVDDLAQACLFLMLSYNESGFINVGSGSDVSIIELVEMLKTVSGFAGAVLWDRSKPDGTPKKRMDISRITQLGWSAKITLEDGLRDVYQRAEFMEAATGNR
jgi:GDP-L-fucose synthase